MRKPSVYLETSVVSYLTAQPSRDIIVAAQQTMTREWWRNAPERFVLVASELVSRKPPLAMRRPPALAWRRCRWSRVSTTRRTLWS